jgi:hypothetical protein
VKPERDKLGENLDADRRRRLYWLWGRYTPALFAAIEKREMVLALSRVSNAFAFAFIPASAVPSDRLDVFTTANMLTFCVLQSRAHEAWARFFGSTLKDDLMYSLSDCFETFPFPRDLERRDALEHIGNQYFEFRAQLMKCENHGMTTTYNQFHNPDCDHPGIQTLRQFHDEMDRTVLDAYGWSDLKPVCEFIPEFDDEEDEESGQGRRKKYRYRWPDDIRDEVLARLLEVNRQRALEEGQLPTAAPTFAAAAKPEAKPKTKRKSAESLPLIDPEEV